MSTNNSNEMDNKPQNNKDESSNSNYNNGSKKIPWIVMIVIGFVGFFAGIQTNTNDLPIHVPLGLIPVFWLCALIGMIMLSKTKKDLGEDPTPSYWNEEQKNQWVKSQASSKDARSSIGNCLKDFKSKHSFLWLVPIFIFGAFACFLFYVIYSMDLKNAKIDNMPGTFKELISFTKSKHPVYSIVLLFIALAIPIIVIAFLYQFYNIAPKDISSVLFALVGLLPAFVVSNFVGGTLSFPFLFINILKGTSNDD